jgi:hypothetical protein
VQAAVQVLHTLYDRSHFDDNEYLILIAPMYEARNVSLLRTLYEWSIVGVENMHSPKYAISKKFSEVRFPKLDEFQSVSAANYLPLPDQITPMAIWP